jgi:ribonuclease P protein component
MNLKFTFSKKEKLCYKKHIDQLFNDGRSFTLNPFKVFYVVTEGQETWPAHVLIAIPSKKFKRAVDRNRLRRLIREAYRLHKHRLNDVGKHLHLGIVYTGNTTAIPFTELEQKIVACLDKLIHLNTCL